MVYNIYSNIQKGIICLTAEIWQQTLHPQISSTMHAERESKNLPYDDFSYLSNNISNVSIKNK